MRKNVYRATLNDTFHRLNVCDQDIMAFNRESIRSQVPFSTGAMSEIVHLFLPCLTLGI